MQVIATGAGAALALDFVSYVRANRLLPQRPVKVCYSSASLALLQFVTNTLLAETTPGIHIKTALTRHDDLKVRSLLQFWHDNQFGAQPYRNKSMKRGGIISRRLWCDCTICVLTSYGVGPSASVAERPHQSITQCVYS